MIANTSNQKMKIATPHYMRTSSGRNRRGGLIRNNPKVKFGEPLEQIPEFINRAFIFLENTALDVEGLFRLPGNTNEIKQLREMLQNGSLINLSPDQVHNVCSLVKMYIRELPIPLCTNECYGMFIACNTIPFREKKIEMLKKVLHYIPANNYELLAKLCLFLKKVSLHSDKNKMTASNLSIVFTPNILVTKIQDPQNQMQIIKELKESQNIITLMIEEARYLFDDMSQQFEETEEYFSASYRHAETDDLEVDIMGASADEVTEKINSYSKSLSEMYLE